MNDTIETLDSKPIITCKRSKGSKFAELKLFGKSEQFKTTGKNLFNISQTTDNGLVTSSIEITDTDYLTGTIKAIFSGVYQQLGVVINAENNTTYTLSFTQENFKKDEIDVRAYYFKDNTLGEFINSIVTSSKDIVFTFSTSKESPIAVWFSPKGVYSQTETNTCTFANIQLEKSASATSYEPYTGGQPSPSPDYPQEIKSVVEPEVKITGKNLYDFGKYIGEYTLNGSNIKASVSKDGTFTVRGTTETYASVAIGNFRVDFPNGDYYVSDSGKKNIIIQAIGEKGAEFRTGETDTHKFINGKRSDLYIVALQAGTFNVTFRPMICKEKEELSTSEPYHEQTVTLPYTLNAIPVSSGGNYTDENGQQWIADYVDVKRGKLVRCVETATFDGSEDEKWNLSTNNNARMFTTTTFNPFSEASTTDAPYIISNMFEFINVNWGVQNRNRIYIETSGRLNIEAPDIEDVDYLKTLLKAENLICHAYRGKTTEIDLTPDEITAYKALHTYTGITNISNDAEAWMQVGYRKVR